MKPKTNPKKGIIAKSQKDAYFEKLKLLTKYLFDPKEIYLKRLISNEEENIKLKYRIYSYFFNHFKLLNYLDKYLNNLYEFESYNIEYFLKTISTIIKISNIRTSNELYFSKFKIDDYNSFHQTIKKYYNTINEHISESEIKNLFLLYQNEVITENDIENINLLLDGKEKKNMQEKKVEELLVPLTNTKEEYSSEIKEFNNGMKSFIKSRTVCRNCPMYRRGSVILDTNLNSPGPVDLIFIGLNPGEEEYKEDKPFIGKSGQLLRPRINKFVEKFDITYAISNIILCWSHNATDIPNIKAVTQNCSGLINEIHKSFPAKLKIIIGSDAAKSVGITGSITKMVGTIVDGYFLMIHPSAVLRNNSNLKYFEKGWEELEKLFSKSNNIVKREEQKLDIIIPQEKIIKQFNNNYTLFDVKIIGEKVIYIMADKNGKKYYMTDEHIQYPVYLKSGDYRNNNYIENLSNIEAVTYLTKEQKELLSKKLYGNLKKTIG